MNTVIKFSVLAGAAVLMYFTDVPPQPSGIPSEVQFVADAHAVFGRQRRTRRRGVAVGYSAGAASAAAASAAASSAPAQQQSTTKQPQAADAPPPAYGPLPLGSVVPQLPAGCTPKAAGGVEYYHCGDNYFRAVFQGNTLVYVTADPG